jgi:hypothetical protein
MTRILVACVVIAAAWPASAQWNVDVGGDPVTGGATSSMSSFDGAGNALLTIRCSAAGGSLRVLVTFPEGRDAAEDVRRAAEAEIRVDGGPQARFPLAVLSQVEGYVSLGRLLVAGRPEYEETVAALASARDRVGIRLGRRSYGFAAAGLQEGLEHLDRRCGLRSAARPAANSSTAAAPANPPPGGAGSRPGAGPVIEPAAAPAVAPPDPLPAAAVQEDAEPARPAPAARGDAPRGVEPEAAREPVREPASDAGAPALEPAPRPVESVAAAAPDPPAPAEPRRSPPPERTALVLPVPAPNPQPAPQAAPTVPAPAEAARPGDAGRVADAVGRARAQIRLGNVAAARALLEHVEASEDRDALFALAETFDPQALRRWGVVGTRPDPGRAASLYRRAAAQGQREAAERLAASAPAKR